MRFTHTPYDGSKRPFTIGLEPLGSRDWLEIDQDRAADLAEKAALIAQQRDAVFREETASRPAQAEAAGLILAALGSAGIDVPAPDPGDPPLLAAARLVQDDLVLMQRDNTGWRLTAAVLCFPSGWSLSEKFGLPMAAIHAEVPGFPGRMNEVVERIFDLLKPGLPVWRLNWSIYGDDRLNHPDPGTAGLEAAPDVDEMVRAATIRIERQTLTRLPESGAILFTIRIHRDPLAALVRHVRRRELALGLRDQLLALTAEEAEYKGLDTVRDRLAGALERIADPAG